MKQLIPLEVIEGKILVIRGLRVLLDRDLAKLYEVETRALNQAVGRNSKRFPADFMITLTRSETGWLVSRNVIPDIRCLGGHLPNAFTEQGVAMLSSVLNSERAIEVNILIMRAFVQLRRVLNSHRDLARKLEELEKKYDIKFKRVFDAIKALMSTADDHSGTKTVHGFNPERQP